MASKSAAFSGALSNNMSGQTLEGVTLPPALVLTLVDQ